MEEYSGISLETVCNTNECSLAQVEYSYSHHAHDRHTLAYCRELGRMRHRVSTVLSPTALLPTSTGSDSISRSISAYTLHTHGYFLV
jgi:hypothetical protein